MLKKIKAMKKAAAMLAFDMAVGFGVNMNSALAAEGAGGETLSVGANMENPQTAKDYWERGSFKAVKKDYDGAIADYNEALKLVPGFVAALNNRGNCYIAKGEYDKAIADFTEAVKIDPNYGDAY